MTAEEWNAKHKIGAGVLVRLDGGALLHTRTRSEAWELGHGRPVVLLEGKTGGYDLARIRPLERQDTPLA